MPQNPLDFFNRLLPAPMGPKTGPSEQERENRDFRAQALQDADPNPLRRFGRQLVDFSAGLLEDPFSDRPSELKGLTKQSGANKGGMLLAAAPIGMPKRLPVIAPEAYQDVKAGDLRLYSRLTDAFAKAPKAMNPDKIRSVARQGASAEEIDLRKLEQFLTGRQPMEKVAREDVMKHLAANPIELDVVKKGQRTRPLEQVEADAQTANRELDQFVHDLETRYGPQWEHRDQRAHNEPPAIGGVDITDEDWARYNELQSRVFDYDNPNAGGPDPTREARYDWLQTPGPKENYGETLINLPTPYKAEKVMEMDEHPRIGEFLGEWGDRDATDADFQKWLQEKNDSHVFTSSHWDEPNNLVWSRYNDRALPRQGVRTPDELMQVIMEMDPRITPENMASGAPLQAFNKGLITADELQEISSVKGYYNGPGNVRSVHPESKGRFIEEIQSDWHQQGREHGYRLPPEEAASAQQRLNEVDLQIKRMLDQYGVPETFDHGLDSPAHPAFPEYKALWDELRELRGKLDPHRVPDAPFKDTYHELALKEQLLDAANQPDLEWLGVADADTVSAMEGHSSVRPGTELYYNQKHPSALEKLLSPLGGNVHHEPLVNHYLKPGKKAILGTDPPSNTSTFDETPHPQVVWHTTGSQSELTRGNDVIPMASILDPLVDTSAVERAIYKRLNEGGGAPSPTGWMWKANLPPELKALIKERGFPAMLALLAFGGLNINNEEQ